MSDSAALVTAELVRRAKRGEAHAFSMLVNRMERTALAIAFGACGDATLAGDVTQEAFLRAWRRLAELHDNARFAAWLCGIVRNLAIDARRSTAGRKRKTRTDDVALETTPAANVDEPLAGLARAEQSQAITRALQQLDEVSRTVIVLRYYENIGSAEIAELIDSTPTAVNMRLSRARRALKDLLAGEMPCGAAAANESRTEP